MSRGKNISKWNSFDEYDKPLIASLENEERLYNPFSLCIFFDKNRLGDYWFESDTPIFMMHLLEQSSFDIPDLEENINLTMKHLDEYRVDYSNIAPLLFQAGYLTIKNYDKKLCSYIAGYPNDEVKYAFIERFMRVYTGANRSFSEEFRIDKFLYSMKNRDIYQALTFTKTLLTSISYDLFPKDKLFLQEHNYIKQLFI